MNAYEQKRQDKADRLKAAAERTRQESDRLYDNAHKMAKAIPFGQPILVGHYSEKRDRNYRGKIENGFRKSFELSDKAEELEERAKAIENNNAIFSDDPDAVEKIEQKIERLEQRQKLMVSANRLVRKSDREGLAALGFSEQAIEKLFTPDCFGGLGFASYALTNNSANIRRLKQRAKDIQNVRDRDTSEIEVGDVRIVNNTEDNRTQIFFPGKPSADIRTELKRSGFRWAPSIGAWQRNYSDYAFAIAKNIVSKYYN